MSHRILPLLVIVVLVAVIAVMSAAMKRQPGKRSDAGEDEEAPPENDFAGYERNRYLLTRAEYSFYKVLHLAVGTEHSIQVKIRLGDLINVGKGAEARRSKVNKILQKHLDFVLCEPKSMVPLVAIELDDKSHDSAKSQKRDVFVNGLLAAVGMPLVRVPAARGYEVPAIKVMVEKALGKKAA